MKSERLALAARPGGQLTAAIWASAFEGALGAGRAEGAFKRTDSGVRRLRRQVSVAAFAIGSHFKHGNFRAAAPRKGAARPRLMA
jgi:hypothetical protein